MKKLPWRKKYTLKPNVPNKPGIYQFYGDGGVLLYVGHASRLRHRVQSYRQDDSFREHPTKPFLRGKIKYYCYSVMPEKKARIVEKRIKKRAIYNFK